MKLNATTAMNATESQSNLENFNEILFNKSEAKVLFNVIVLFCNILKKLVLPYAKPSCCGHEEEP